MISGIILGKDGALYVYTHNIGKTSNNLTEIRGPTIWEDPENFFCHSFNSSLGALPSKKPSEGFTNPSYCSSFWWSFLFLQTNKSKNPVTCMMKLKWY